MQLVKRKKLQINFRVPAELRDALDSEIVRQGRKRDWVAERIISEFLALKSVERDRICAVRLDRVA